MELIRNIKKMNQKYNIGLIIYIFCFLFAPPVIPNVNFIFVLATYSLVVILVKYRKKLGSLFTSKTLKNLIGILGVYFIIYTLSILINGFITKNWHAQNYIINFYSLILAFPVTFICVLYIVFRTEELELNLYDVIRLFIWAGMIQAVIAILTLVFPSIKKICMEMMYAATGDELLTRTWLTERRYYGFAHSMLDLFGFGTGILAVLPLYYGLKVNKKYMILSPILLIVPILNSRSGLIIFAIGVLVLLVTNIRKIRLSSFIIGIIGIVICVVIVYLIVKCFSPSTIEWITKDLLSFTLDEKDENSTANVLFSKEFWSLPPIENLLIGTGHNVSAYSDYAVQNIPHSDVGYINELWKVGIVGSCAIYYFLYYILKNAIINLDKKTNNSLYIFLGISIIVFLVKASIFTYNPGMAIIYTLAFIPIYKGKENSENKHSE